MANDLVSIKSDPSLDDIVANIHRIRGEAVKAVKSGIIEIGRQLVIAKSKIPHGDWKPWLDRNFQWSDRTAQRYMADAADFDKYAIEDKSDTGVGFDRLNIDTAAFHALAGSGVPEEARQEAVTRARGGEHINTGKAKAIVDKHRPARPPSSKPSRGWGYHPEKDRHQSTDPHVPPSPPVQPDVTLRVTLSAKENQWLCDTADALAVTPDRVIHALVVAAIAGRITVREGKLQLPPPPATEAVPQIEEPAEQPEAPTGEQPEPATTPPAATPASDPSTHGQQRWRRCDRLRAERKRLGLTQRQLADKLGVHQTLIAKYESGVANPSLPVAYKLAEVTGLPVNYLLTVESIAPDLGPVEADGPGEVEAVPAPVKEADAADRVVH